MAKGTITEVDRIALAHHEFEQNAAKIRRKMESRSSILKRALHSSEKLVFQRLCNADQEMQELASRLTFHECWRDFVIQYDCVPTLEKDGKIRWALPESLRKVN